MDLDSQLQTYQILTYGSEALSYSIAAEFDFKVFNEMK